MHLRSADGPVVTVIEGASSFAPTLTAESGEGPETIVEGLTLMRPQHEDGPGMEIDGSSPTVRNCHFISHGYDVAKGPSSGIRMTNSDSVIEDCFFYDNVDPERGGAIAIEGGAPTIIDSMFVQNRHLGDLDPNTGGGAIAAIQSDVLIKQCVFVDNGLDPPAAPFGGGGAVALYGNGTIDQCVFDGNGGSFGGAVAIGRDSIVTNSHFTNNTAIMGGAVFTTGVYGEPATVQNCTFEHNTATGGGGAISAQGNLVVTDCEMEYNDAQAGGAMHAGSLFDDVLVESCTFFRNESEASGGAIAKDFSSDYRQQISVVDSEFIENKSGELGGAVAYADEKWVAAADVFSNCTFDANGASKGGAFFISDDAVPPVIGESTFCANTRPTLVGQWVDDGGNKFIEFCPDVIPGDLNGDDAVDGADLGILLSEWGPCFLCGECPAELTGDCAVDGADLGVLLSNWTE